MDKAARAQPHADTPSIEVRLARIEARLGIETALADYCIDIDDRDPARWLAAFHEDAVYDVDLPACICRGHGEILDWVLCTWQSRMLNHLSTNHRNEFVDSHSADGVAHAIALFCLPDGANMIGTARYTDRYEERDGVWRIAFRKVKIIALAELNDLTYRIFNGAPVDN
jgi:gamma-hexachlorocyclohexane dehydrochlorinase